MKNSMQKKILIVDDDPTIRKVTRQVVERSGYGAIEVDCGRSAVESFNQSKPDAILLDVGLPDVDGFDVCNTIRQLPNGQHIPIIMMTGRDDVNSIDKAYEVDATDFLTKPIKWALLGHKIKYLIRAGHAFNQLHKNERRLINAKHVAKIAEWEYDINNKTLSWSNEVYDLFQLNHGTSIKQHFDILNFVHRQDVLKVSKGLDKLFKDFESYDLEYRINTRGEPGLKYLQEQAQVIYDDNGHPTSIIGAIRDVTTNKKIEEEVRYLAYFDNLTGLPNRSLFTEHLQCAINTASRNKNPLSILFLDLDNFKRVNDTLGHNAGDKFLKVVARKLLKSLRKTDYISVGSTGEIVPAVSRLGGDEFIILLHNNATVDGAGLVAQRVLDLLNTPIVIDNTELPVSVSIGISMYPDDGMTAEDLLKNADVAMYHAKELGKNTFRFYDKKLNELAADKLQLEADLQRALQNNEFVLHYQPKVNANTFEIVGMEALIRWQHPQRGLIFPDSFIPIADSSNLILPMGNYLLEAACKQLQAWHKAGLNHAVIAINISARQFIDPNFICLIKEAIRKYDVKPDSLEIEVTEGVLMDNTQHTHEVLQELNELGLCITIDDFGTGYSSLQYISQFPLDTIKIDKSFIDNLENNQHGMMISEAIIALAHRLKLNVIAEGVEDLEQLRFLQRNQCDEIQGYLFSKPVTEDKMTKLLEQQKLLPQFK